MNWIDTGLRSKVGRRMLAVFCLSSLVPLFAFAVVSYREVDHQIEQQTSERMHRATKSTAQLLVGRMQLLADDMHELAADLRRVDASPDIARTGQARQRFLSIGIQFDRGILTALHGEPPPVVEISGDARGHLSAGKCVVSSTTGPERRVVMALALEPHQPDRGLLVTLPNPLFLFGREDAHVDAPGTAIFVVNDRRQILFSSSPVSLADQARLAAALPDAPSGEFRWEYDGTDCLAASWSIPLSFEFHTAPWTVVRSESVSWVFAPLESFQRSFLFLTAITLLIALALSSNQIRRSLTPLARLREGTRRVAAGDFLTTVNISSGDEFEELARSFNAMSREIQELHVSTLTALAHAVDAKSSWTAGHTERVCEIALALARRMGLSEAELVTLQRGALLHDIGKIGVPTHLLDKPGPLTPSEMEQVRAHPAIGARILEPIKPFAETIPLVRGHHERVDGRGYPDGLKGDAIRLDVRILTVADALDAMISDRPYRQGMSLDKATSILRQEAGGQFDPRVVEALLEMLDQRGSDSVDLFRHRTCPVRASGLVHLVPPAQRSYQREVH